MKPGTATVSFSMLLCSARAPSTRLASLAPHRLSLYSRLYSKSQHEPVESQDVIKEPIELDTSYKALLKDVDLSLLRQTSRRKPHEHEPHFAKDIPEIEASSVDAIDNSLEEDYAEYGMDSSERRQRKSPAAAFGSQSIGQVVLPLELREAITGVIEKSNKSMLHTDARRLFHEPSSESSDTWDSTPSHRYKSRRQAVRHQTRDGAAIASIGLPPQYSVIYAVLSDLRFRLGSQIQIERVLEWGGGLGAGIWASLRAFTKPGISTEEGKELLVDSSINMYWVYDKNKGLVSMGKHLLDSTTHNTSINFQNAQRPGDAIPRSQGSDAIALTAFTLSTLRDPILRKEQVKQMWESGTEFIILIDHGNAEGFEAIAEAREYLLRVGRREDEAKAAGEVWEDDSKRGCHVISPCPHDGFCPIHGFIRLHPTKKPQITCSFSQRLQRPDFMRKTKKSGKGFEDTTYSYVVIRRGARPKVPASQHGRERRPSTSGVAPHPEDDELPTRRNVWVQGPDDEMVLEQHEQPPSSAPNLSDEELDTALRLEAYSWPRLIVPPLKRSGHAILDSCTPDGSIKRITIPRSQGKQPFYDARKSSWGDLFPHDPKNPPVVRYPALTTYPRATHPSKPLRTEAED